MCATVRNYHDGYVPIANHEEDGAIFQLVSNIESSSLPVPNPLRVTQRSAYTYVQTVGSPLHDRVT